MLLPEILNKPPTQQSVATTTPRNTSSLSGVVFPKLKLCNCGVCTREDQYRARITMEQHFIWWSMLERNQLDVVCVQETVARKQLTADWERGFLVLAKSEESLRPQPPPRLPQPIVDSLMAEQEERRGDLLTEEDNARNTILRYEVADYLDARRKETNMVGTIGKVYIPKPPPKESSSSSCNTVTRREIRERFLALMMNVETEEGTKREHLANEYETEFLNFENSCTLSYHDAFFRTRFHELFCDELQQRNKIDRDCVFETYPPLLELLHEAIAECEIRRQEILARHQLRVEADHDWLISYGDQNDRIACEQEVIHCQESEQHRRNLLLLALVNDVIDIFFKHEKGLRMTYLKERLVWMRNVSEECEIEWRVLAEDRIRKEIQERVERTTLYWTPNLWWDLVVVESDLRVELWDRAFREWLEIHDDVFDVLM
eukprot:PhF_6_TR5548/c0_g1_i1/m.7914